MRITQYSRISHHTTTSTQSTTFTVPSTEDFTTGSWTIYDLAQSEIGVNEGYGRSFIRVGSKVKEFSISDFATASTNGTASATLYTFTRPITDDVVWVEGKVKSKSNDSNNYGYVADLFFGVRNSGTNSVALVGSTYSVKAYWDFSAQPTLNVSASGLTCSITIGGLPGFTMSWSGNFTKG
jgi:hypothetical protein